MTYYCTKGNTNNVVHATKRCDYLNPSWDLKEYRDEIVAAWDTLETCDVCCESD